MRRTPLQSSMSCCAGNGGQATHSCSARSARSRHLVEFWMPRSTSLQHGSRGERNGGGNTPGQGGCRKPHRHSPLKKSTYQRQGLHMVKGSSMVYTSVQKVFPPPPVAKRLWQAATSNSASTEELMRTRFAHKTSRPCLSTSMIAAQKLGLRALFETRSSLLSVKLIPGTRGRKGSILPMPT